MIPSLYLERIAISPEIQRCVCGALSKTRTYNPRFTKAQHYLCAIRALLVGSSGIEPRPIKERFYRPHTTPVADTSHILVVQEGNDPSSTSYQLVALPLSYRTEIQGHDCFKMPKSSGIALLQKSVNWCRRRGSNSLRKVFQTFALPTMSYNGVIL